MPHRTLQISRRNSTYQVLESLIGNRQKRHRSCSFLVEGVQPINTALERGWAVDSVLYERGAPLSRWARNVILRADADRYELSPDLFRALSRKNDPPEIIAVLRMPPDSLDRIPVRRDLLAAVMDRPSNPGNLGTLIRSCDAFGLDGLIVTGHGVDMYDPATITASRGSLFAIPVVHAGSHTEVGQWVETVRQRLGTCHIVGADEAADLNVSDYPFASPTVLIFGNEAHGLSHAYKQLCDARIRIPIGGSATSLNVAVAGSIILYEARQSLIAHR